MSLGFNAHGELPTEVKEVEVIDSAAKYLDKFIEENPNQKSITVMDLTSGDRSSRFAGFKNF